MNLVEALLAENEKSRKLIAECEETARLMPACRSVDLPPGVGSGVARRRQGVLMSIGIYKALIKQTEAAIASGDVLKMLAAAKAHGLAEVVP